MFRKCPEHGWLATSEYTTDEHGETVCPICLNDPDNCGREGAALHGFKHDPPNGVLKRAQSNPRDKFTSEMDINTNETKTISTDSSSSEFNGPLFGDE